MLRFIFVLVNLAILVAVCLGFALIGAQLIVNGSRWYQVVGGMGVIGIAGALLLWGGEAVGSYLLPKGLD